MQRMLVVGGHGTIGKLVIAEMADGYEAATAGRSNGDYHVDIADGASIKAMFSASGKFDVLVCAAGNSAFASVESVTDDELHTAADHKLFGQVNLVRAALPNMNDGGVIVLTSGCTNVQPVRNGSVSALINGGLDGFVTAAACDMPRGIRINCVSPGILTESAEHSGYKFPGFKTVDGVDVARAYQRCVATGITGHIIYVH